MQVVVDNFDTDISSPYGKLSTHSLAMIVTQPANVEYDSGRNNIRRPKQDDMSQPIEDDLVRQK